MDILSTLNDNSILVIPNNLRNKVLKYFHEKRILSEVKIMTFNDLKKGILFDYTNQTIFNVMKEKKVSYQIAKEYINSLYYLNNEIKDSKYDDLTRLKEKLDKDNLLVYDPLFKELLKNKKCLYIFGFEKLSKFNEHLIDIAKEYIDIVFLDKVNNKYSHKVYKFNKMDEEIFYVAESIAKLVEKGIDLNNIFIANYSPEYKFTIEYIFESYGIPIYLPSDESLFSTQIAKYFLDNLAMNPDVLFDKMRKKFKSISISENESIITKLFNLVNKYYWCDNLTNTRDLLIAEMKNTKISKTHMDHEVTTTSLVNNYFTDDEYVFLIGFNNGTIPKIKKDEDYIEDRIKPSFVDKSYETNEYLEYSIIKAINNIKNLTITYKLSSRFNNYLPSYLLNCEQLKLVKCSDNTVVSEYSDNMNKLVLAQKLDDLVIFNIKDDYLDLLLNTYNINYKSYTNQFSGIDQKSLWNRIDNNITLSYTNINDFYKCPFKFYLSNILKINEFEDLFEAFIGSLFHYCLEKCLDTTLDIGEVYDDYINNNFSTPSNKETFFLSMLKDEIITVISLIKEQYKHSEHNQSIFEKKIEFELNNNIKFKIKGFVDKLLVFNNEAIIIDYKTNNSSINLKNLPYGIDIQLPIYLYLLKIVEPDIKVCGLYLQHILTNNKKLKEKITKEELTAKNLKLVGLTLSDNIKYFDDTYESSSVIEGLKTKDGNITGKNVLNDEQTKELLELMEKLIKNCIKEILQGNFVIHPLVLDDVSACKYCKYKDICFRKQVNYNYQTTKGSDIDE